MTDIITAIGFSTGVSGKGDLSRLDATLASLAEIGADAAELSLYGEDLITGGRLLPDRVHKLEQICRRHDLRYTVHGQIVSNFMDEAHLPLQKAVVRAMLELCDQVGATVLVHHAGQAPMTDAAGRERLDDLEREALAELAEAARGYGVRLAFENIFAMGDHEYRQTPAEVADTVRAVGHPSLCGLIDFSHAYIECTRRRLDWRDQIRSMAAATGHLHVHDSFGRPYSMTRFFERSQEVALGIGDLHLPLGWGDIPWDEIFTELRFQPGTTMILELNGDRYAAELAESLARARRLAALCNHQALAA
jgi:sugar phosphate isomerase/epimerase